MVRVFWAKIENICTHIPAITYGFLNTSPGSLFFSPKKGGGEEKSWMKLKPLLGAIFS